MNNFLDTMTEAQLYRLFRKAWARMTWGDGYQPWCYDRRTLAITQPEWLQTLDTINAAYKRKVNNAG